MAQISALVSWGVSQLLGAGGGFWGCVSEWERQRAVPCTLGRQSVMWLLVEKRE